jgi:hypothetical protein
MSFKQKIYAHCLQILNTKIQDLEKILAELSESATNNTKSSAGDKHETGRAMIQIEQETIGKQLHEALEQKLLLEKIDITTPSLQVIKGSLVATNKGYLFLSIALGKIIVDEKAVMVISSQSPLGMKLMGLKANDTTQINRADYVLERIY